MTQDRKPEVWIPVKGFEARYKISSHGRLMSINGKYKGERFYLRILMMVGIMQLLYE